MRYKQCRKDTQPLAGTKFSLLNIPCSTWLIILNLFELSISARKAAKEAGFGYKTTLKGYDILRHVITEELAKSDDLLKGEKEFFENRDTPMVSSGSLQSGPGTPLPCLATAGCFSKE